MPDNTTLNAGTAGDLIATDELTTINGVAAPAGLKVQRVKATFGADGVATDVSAATPLPTQIGNGTASAGVEPFGALIVNNGFATLFYDSWSVSPIDTVDKWTVTGTAPTIAGGRQALTFPVSDVRRPGAMARHVGELAGPEARARGGAAAGSKRGVVMSSRESVRGASGAEAWWRFRFDFFDENGNHVQTLDVWWFIEHYETYCREHGLEINRQLYL